MRNISIPVYSFDELNDKAKEKVLENYRYAKTECFDWYADTIENAKTELKEEGYENADIKFSSFGSQGDGASFTASVNLLTVCKLFNIELPQSFLDWCKDQDASLDVVRGTSGFSNHYVHEDTVYAEWQNAFGAPEQFDNLMAELVEKVDKDVRRLSRKIYQALESEYKFLTADAAVADTVCDMEFTADGELAPETN